MNRKKYKEYWNRHLPYITLYARFGIPLKMAKMVHNKLYEEQYEMYKGMVIQPMIDEVSKRRKGVRDD